MLTPEQVLQLVGATVTTANISTAAAMVSTYLGFDVEESSLSPKKLKRVNLGISWQSVYVRDNPEVATQHAGLQSASTNGVSATYKDVSGDNGSFLSALAKSALAPLAGGNRTYRIKNARAVWMDDDDYGTNGERWKPL